MIRMFFLLLAIYSISPCQASLQDGTTHETHTLTVLDDSEPQPPSLERFIDDPFSSCTLFRCGDKLTFSLCLGHTPGGKRLSQEDEAMHYLTAVHKKNGTTYAATTAQEANKRKKDIEHNSSTTELYRLLALARKNIHNYRMAYKEFLEVLPSNPRKKREIRERLVAMELDPNKQPNPLLLLVIWRRIQAVEKESRQKSKQES